MDMLKYKLFKIVIGNIPSLSDQEVTRNKGQTVLSTQKQCHYIVGPPESADEARQVYIAPFRLQARQSALQRHRNALSSR